MMRRKRIIILVGILIGVLVLAAGPNNLYQSLRTFNRVLNIIENGYVEEVNPTKLVRKAINGMLHSLDPHSTYLDEDSYKELMVRTRGKFGGLGIQIGIRNGWLTIIAPIEGTPAYRAGLQAGDVIANIEGISTKGITIMEAVHKLRGKPGTKVTITIKREGSGDMDYQITRAIIEIKNVPYYGMLSNDIGYVRLISFSNGAGNEVAEALDELSRKGAKKIILDLTGNPGGLLKEAVKVADNFVDKGDIIVLTKGRVKRANAEYRAEKEAKYGDFPLVVLVDGASASASEIVAGAVQDWNRGLIIGDTTYGKGSVQNVIPLTDHEALKLTTARYYTPSGRCIDKSDTLRFLLSNPTAGKEFTTMTEEPERELHGGGGIIPDIVVKYPKIPAITVISEIWRKGLFIAYAARHTRKHQDIRRGFEISPEIMSDFKTFLEDKEVKFTQEQFDKADPFIKQWLKSAISEDIWGTKGRYEESYLPYNPLVKKAKEVLEKSSTVNELFSGLRD